MNRPSTNYTPLEQYFFLENGALNQRMTNMEGYIDELEERMSVLETVISRLLRDNWQVQQATEAVIYDVMGQENMSDDLQRLLDDFDDEWVNAQQDLIDYVDQFEV